VLKLFQFWTRRADRTSDEALRCLRAVHAPRIAAAAPPEVLRYVSNVGLPTRYSGWIEDEAPAFDGVEEWWVDADDVPSLRSATLGAGLVRGEHDRELIGTAELMVAEQIVHVDHARAHRGVKTMFLLTRRSEMTRQEAMDYWHEQHAPLVRKTLGDTLVRYATNIGVDADLIGWPDQSPPFDGVAELWLDLPMKEMHAAVAAVADVLLPDERAFLGTYRWLATEELVHRGGVAPLPVAAGAGAR